MPHGNVGEEDVEDEDDSPNDGSNSEDSDRLNVGNFLTCGIRSPPTIAGVATNGVLVSKPVADVLTVSVEVAHEQPPLAAQGPVPEYTRLSCLS